MRHMIEPKTAKLPISMYGSALLYRPTRKNKHKRDVEEVAVEEGLLTNRQVTDPDR